MRNYAVMFIRWYFYEYGDFYNFEKTDVFEEVEKEAKKKKVSVNELLCKALGFKKDSNLSSEQRFDLATEIAENLKNEKFWIEKAREFGVARTSKVVERFSDLGVLGPGVMNTSPKTCPYVFDGFNSFLNDYKDIIDVFCAGADFLESPLSSQNDRLTYYDLKDSVFVDKTYEGFKATLNKLGLKSARSLLNLTIGGKKIVMTSQGLNVPPKTFKGVNFDFACDCIFYAYLISADKISPFYFKQAKILSEALRVPFTMTDKQSADLVCLSFCSGLTVSEIGACFGVVLPKLSESLRTTDGLFSKVTYSVKGSSETLDLVYYLPSYSKGVKDIPTKILLSDFVFLLQKNLEVTYQDSVPYVNGSPAIVMGV